MHTQEYTLAYPRLRDSSSSSTDTQPPPLSPFISGDTLLCATNFMGWTAVTKLLHVSTNPFLSVLAPTTGLQVH
ncbi:hypothetical protein DUNSADRAFT_18206 [Dunaliella salina]|uniref:Encoded protein n=1 Tax=Dunaliella salina TaxID=3046 RepID=A0ABQ7G0G4_DUNSA|nr:hypothetical protein DUNSADRAFT_18206 [Dunaliella salina]|eukprot:KAF5828096.1 hypothetical protein DUNSADRAFT_18206 [Dunaliella salina]